MSDIEQVKSFWNSNPLWTGESKFEPGTRDFFEEHRKVYIEDCFGGNFDIRFLPTPRSNAQQMKILDLGCGIGFWTTEFAMRGYNNLFAADLTPAALAITKQRLQLYGLEAQLFEENAEALSFPDESFDHVNCQGVIHHTPNTAKSVSEIARVIKCGGTASISVYYRNLTLRFWPLLRWLAYPLALFGGGLKGRGRENIFKKSDVDDIVRIYDGDANPIGKSYTLESFKELIKNDFEIEEIYFHFFPARSLPFRIPKSLHRWLDRKLPFMIYANLKKKCVE
ncbi:MAG: class I SAM-dependent methyltransferase [Chitinophagaceae bacterium]|nr:class I SAM-dependent methyltransferase [Chitinophagaceae bacterium]